MSGIGESEMDTVIYSEPLSTGKGLFPRGQSKDGPQLSLFGIILAEEHSLAQGDARIPREAHI